MTTILVILYAFFFIMVGVAGNAPGFLAMVGTEKQFLYWVIVLLVIAALWQSTVAEPLAKGLAVLIVIGFLVSHDSANARKIAANLKQILPAVGG